ncbi:MAG TPA: MFS transporter [Burkholderiaceae bacterium]|nr:MFS transporter [Burkholderiaceae bacterium]
MFQALKGPGVWVTTLAAAALLMVTMGARQTTGLFVSPLNSTTGLGIATISFALAIGQFVWGAVQPVAGAIADRYGPRHVLVAAVLLMALGTALTPFMTSAFGLMVSLGLLMSIGSGAAGFSVLIGAASQRLPAQARGQASGVINAGGSFGQFVFAPLTQKLIQVFGWMGALWVLAGLTLAALPLIGVLTRQARGAAPAGGAAGGGGSSGGAGSSGSGQAAGGAQAASPAASATSAASSTSATSPASAAGASTNRAQGLRHAVADAMRNPSYLLLHAGFFTCGFHIAFLVTHLPGDVELCGLPPSVAGWSLAIIGLANIVGSLLAGSWVSRHRSKMVLAAMYGSRAVLIAAYLVMPKTEAMYYLFAAGLGLTWLATVPPTATLVGKLFGIKYLSTLFGLTLLSHQIGGFLGAWLGGLAITRFGDYTWMWYADMVLAAFAAIVNLPIREARMRPAPAAA